MGELARQWHWLDTPSVLHQAQLLTHSKISMYILLYFHIFSKENNIFILAINYRGISQSLPQFLKTQVDLNEILVLARVIKRNLQILRIKLAFS